MSQLSTILRDTEDNGLMFWCPGCDSAHGIRYGEGSGPRWTWNGSADKPTFQPSILVRGSEFTEKGRADYMAWVKAGDESAPKQFEFKPIVCHSYVTDGRIQFLGDCTHALAGQTVDLPNWDAE